MTRHHGAAAAALPLLLVAACSGASGDATGATDAAATPAPRASSTSPAPASTLPTEEAPAPGSTAKPGTTSGGLDRSLFPTPENLGTGWAYRVDAGDAEEGYAGNGTPALARDPAEVATTAVPFGCTLSRPLPRPTHALEVDYRLAGRDVVAVRATFAAAATARDYYDSRRDAVSACEGVEVDAATGPVVTAVRRLGPDTMTNVRTPDSQPWFEIATLTGADVVLVAVQGTAPAASVLDPVRTARLFR